MLVEKSISRKKIFWIFHTAGLSILTALIIILYVKNLTLQPDWVLHFFLRYSIMYFVCIFLAQYYRKTSFRSGEIARDLFVSGIVFVIGAHIWLVLEILKDILITANLEFPDPVSLSRYLHDIFWNFIYLLLWSGFFFGIKFWLDLSEQKAENEYADVLLKDAQLRMLRHQLNPHFLFNSLNSIRALISENTARAENMITELTEFLRYSLKEKNYDNVPLSEELKSIDHYLSIEKERYEDKLTISRQIDREAKDFPILNFLLHPVIENAVKFGMMTSRMPLEIKINAVVDTDTLKISVSNTGKWVESEIAADHMNSGTGTGLNNIRMRLENAYPDRHVFKINEGDQKVNVMMEIKPERNNI
ncbi:MAG: hypothetical protein GY863_04210 [bacterium]|nr:hypothetical protein [bacterium]